MVSGSGYPRVFVRRVVVENFKSIRCLELELEPGVNLLVGPNGGGKTNLLEALYFLYKSLVEDAGKIPYVPHSPRYWSPLDLIYMRDPSSRVAVGLGLEYYFVLGEKIYRLDAMFKTVFAYDGGLDTLVPVAYDVWLGSDTRFSFSPDGVSISIEKNLFEEVVSTSDSGRELSEKYVLEGKYYVFKAPWTTSLPKPFLLTNLPIIGESVSQCIRDDLCVLRDSIAVVKGVELPYIVKTREAGNGRGLVLLEEGKVRITAPPGLKDLLNIIGRVLEGFLLLRHPDVIAISEPRPFTGEARLNDRATNLAPVLLALQGRRGGFPPRISRALGELFPGLSFRLESRFGRVVLVGEEDGLELPPSNIPDGAVKLLAILTAVELRPSLLLIDEVENSMHARMLEYVVDELNSLDIPVIVATHSPVVVDLVGPERTIIVYKKHGEGTVAERIRDPGELSRRIRELGLSVSDYVFYKKTYEL